MTKRALLFFTLTAGLYAQGQPTTESKALEPKSGYAITPVLIKDEGCARDYLKAQSLGGLEGRKMLVDLAEYGCIKKLQRIYLALAEPPRIVAYGKQKLVIRQVRLMEAVTLEDI